MNKTTFTPGENVIVTLRGGRTSGATNGVGGWVRGILYRDNVEIARSAGTVAPGNIGPSGGSGLPITFTTAAPTTPGTYTYAAAWFGNINNTGSTHGEDRAPTITIAVAAASAAGPLTVTPAGGLTSSGIAGGPFTPLSQTYWGSGYGVEGARPGSAVQRGRERWKRGCVFGCSPFSIYSCKVRIFLISTDGDIIAWRVSYK